jgi:Uma2 family endonuclease
MTFAEFEQLPNPRGKRLELHHGELVEVAEPKHKHYLRQRRIRRLIESVAGHAGEVDIEMAYRPLAEYECWAADVAFVSRKRWDAIPPNGNLSGAPELVIEVLSPSNTAPEMREKRKLCLENGAREFWVVDDDYREIEVWTPDDRSLTYRSGQEIPLFFAPGTSLRVDDIFA